MMRRRLFEKLLSVRQQDATSRSGLFSNVATNYLFFKVVLSYSSSLKLDLDIYPRTHLVRSSSFHFVHPS